MDPQSHPDQLLHARHLAGGGQRLSHGKEQPSDWASVCTIRLPEAPQEPPEAPGGLALS